MRSRRVAAVLMTAAALAAGCATTVAPPPAAPPPPVALPPPPPPVVAPPPPVAEPEPVAEAAPPAEPQPRARLDPLDDSARGDLWQRLRDGFALRDADGELVRKWEQWYASRPDYVERMTARGARYLFHIVEEVVRRGLPTELALLPFVESAFNPQALSAARAAGMWQFMPATGREFELRQNLFRDDRRDIIESTRAALGYLEQLYAQFGDWQLALAAYNWGQGNVQRALARSQRAGKPATYEHLWRMPDETRNYVPKLQAIKNLVLRPEAYALTLPPLENHPYFITVAVLKDIDVELAAQLAGLSLEQFEQLNPQINPPVILAAGSPRVLLPYDNANRFVRQVAEYKGPLASWTTWVAPKTVKPGDVARLVGWRESELREVNRIPARMLVRAGSTLLVPRDADDRDVVEVQAHNAAIAFMPERAVAKKRAAPKGKAHGKAAVARGRGAAAPATAAKATSRVAAGAAKVPAAKAAAAKASPRRDVRRAAARSTRLAEGR